jgi:transcriptional regulator
MYIPAANAETNPDTLFAFITQSPLGALVTVDAGGDLVATHLPWLVDRQRGEHGVLEGHIARANSQHAAADAWSKALVIFTGPDAYITPSWYAAKAEHGKVVPTWNYVAVHVYGRVRFTSEHSFLARHLERLVARHESGRPAPWAIGDAPAEYIERQMKAIVGVELVIERIEGKWKMSQNRSAADVDGVVQGLGASSDPRDRAVGEIMKRLSVDFLILTVDG